LKELGASLSPSEAVLEYVIDEPASYCVVVTRENARIVKLQGKQVISPLVSAYLSEVKAKHSAKIRLVVCMMSCWIQSPKRRAKNSS